MNNLKDLCKIGECKTALDIGFTFEFYEDDGNTESSWYYVNVYKSKTDNKYTLIETNSTHDILYGFGHELFGDFCEAVIKYLEVV
ncbi:MAG: hypothetical protein ACRDDY_04290 [Clostridium sp.]|uniref:hypothetical protein n=1 Tax=Clostridium sp. TaxID=1506 RepID=UPI003EE4B9B7